MYKVGKLYDSYEDWISNPTVIRQSLENSAQNMHCYYAKGFTSDQYSTHIIEAVINSEVLLNNGQSLDLTSLENMGFYKSKDAGIENSARALLWFHSSITDTHLPDYEIKLNVPVEWGQGGTGISKVVLMYDTLRGKKGIRVGFLSGLENRRNLKLDLLNTNLIPQLKLLSNRPQANFQVKFQYVSEGNGIYLLAVFTDDPLANAVMTKIANQQKPRYHLIHEEIELRLVSKKDTAIKLKKKAPKDPAWKLIIWNTADILALEIHEAITDIAGTLHAFSVDQKTPKSGKGSYSSVTFDSLAGWEHFWAKIRGHMIIIGDRARTLEVSTQALGFTPSEDSSEPPAQAWAPLTSDKYEDLEKRLMGKLEMRLQSTDERIANLEQASQKSESYLSAQIKHLNDQMEQQRELFMNEFRQLRKHNIDKIENTENNPRIANRPKQTL